MTVRTNNDGLTILSGVDEARKLTVAEYTTSGPRRLVEVDINADNLPAAAAATILTQSAKIPLGVLIEDAEFVVYEAFDSANDTADLHIGLCDSDDVTGNVQTIVVDATVVELTPLGVLPQGTTPLDGNAVGAVTAGDAAKVFRVLVDDQVFTAGKGVLRVWYSVPQSPEDNLGA